MKIVGQLLVVLGAISLTTSQVKYLVTPRNVASMMGENNYRILNCTINYTRAMLKDWDWLSWNSDIFGESFDPRMTVGGKIQFPGKDEYPMEVYNGSDANGHIYYNIKLPVTIEFVAANYSCVLNETEGYLKKYNARFVIIEEPTCNTNANGVLNEGDVVDHTCEVSYYNYPHPQMEWTSPDGEILTFTDESSVPWPHNTKKTSVKVTLAAKHHDKWIEVRTFFQEIHENLNTAVETWATNAPEFEHVHKFPKMNVSYGPQNVVISPDIEYVVPDHVLYCSADANPAAEYYTWSDVSHPDQQDKILKEGVDNSIVLSDEFVGRIEVMIVCTVRNKLFNQETREKSGQHSFRMNACPYPYPPPHTVLIDMDLNDQGTALFRCMPGYAFVSGVESATTFCDNFAWTQQPPECKNIDECLSSPCQHGVCNDKVLSYTCECAEGWEGVLCETKKAGQGGGGGAPPSADKQTGLIAGIAVGLIALIAAGVIIILFLLRKMKKKKYETGPLVTLDEERAEEANEAQI